MNEGRRTDAPSLQVAGVDDRSSTSKRAPPAADAIRVLARLVATAAAELRASPAALMAAVKAELGVKVEDPAFRLREANHRFKNEMQMLASGIEAQTLDIPSQPTSRDCLRCLGRVMGIAQVHSALEEVTGDLVPLAPFLRRLANNVIAASGKDDQVMLCFELTPLSVGPDAAVGIALFLNEALVNALKHGFPDSRRGEITVALRRDGADGRLVIQDNGVGASPAEPGAYRMLRGLARQIDGQFRRLDADRGFAVELAFRLGSVGCC